MANDGPKGDAADEAARTLIEKAAPDDELRGLADDDSLRRELAETIREIEKLENALPEGTTSVTLGRFALPISETSWILLEAAAGLALLAAGPEPVTKITGGGLLVNALFKVRSLIRVLDQTDQAVCAAIAEKRRGKRWQDESETRVTKPEIIAYFHDRDEDAPRDLDKVLDELVNQNVLTRERENDISYYSIEF